MFGFLLMPIVLIPILHRNILFNWHANWLVHLALNVRDFRVNTGNYGGQFMSKYSSMWYKAWSGVTDVFSSIKWTGLASQLKGGKPGWNLTLQDWEEVAQVLANGYCIILTRRNTHLTTYLIGMITKIKTGVSADYTHALMNLDLVDHPGQFMDFKLMESTSNGVITASSTKCLTATTCVF